jgi:hypothetical protein
VSQLLERRAEILNRLPMVTWDRCAHWSNEPPGMPECLAAFGWIERSDGARDFVLVEFLWPEEPLLCTSTTSSAKYSAELVRLLMGADAPHVECERITDALHGLVDNTVDRRAETS